MKKTLLFIAVILLSNITFGQSRQSEQLDSLFTSLYNKKMFNGNVLIAEKGKTLFQKSYGLANEEIKQELNNQTIFELASVSKQFTAMGIVLLKNQGKLKYDDKISKYIPELSFYGDITIQNLLNHTGGLPDYMELFEEKWDKTKFATNQSIVDLFVQHKPEADFKAGEKFEYSNTGYAFLGLIIEKASNKTFGQYLNENIFKPLKMTKTFVYRSRYEPKTVENYALGYVTDSLGNKVLTNSFGKEFYTYYLDGIVGDGMVNSTTEDLLKWDRALYGNKLVNQKDKELIFSKVKTNNGDESKYGFGWSIGTAEKYGKIVNHSGGWAGYVTFIERHLDNDKTIIILQNNATELTALPVREVRRILYNEPLATNDLNPVELTSKDLEKYVGIYSNEQIPFTLTIWVKDSTLFAQASGEGQGAFPLDSYENHTFKFDPVQVKIIFDTDKNELDFYQGNMNLKFKKTE